MAPVHLQEWHYVIGRITLVFETRNEAERYEGVVREMVSLATTIDLN